MINDPSVMAIIQARRNFNARDPSGITTVKNDPGQTDPAEPGGNQTPVQPPPQVSPADRAIARQNMMNNYMQRMGLQGYRYGAGNVRTGNIPRGGSDGAGYQSLVPGALPVTGTPPVSGGTLTPQTLASGNGPPSPPPAGFGPVAAPPPTYPVGTAPPPGGGRQFGAI